MKDLISKQAVIALLKRENAKRRDIEEVLITERNIELIRDMPVVFNVEKIVEELEKMKVNTDTVESRHHNMIIDICADTVKRGGVE